DFNDIIKISEYSALANIGHAIVDPFIKSLENLSKGIIEVEGSDMPYIQCLLFKNFDKSFDAVSDRDIDFWAQKKDKSFYEEYFHLNDEALNRNVKLTRIFIFDD